MLCQKNFVINYERGCVMVNDEMLTVALREMADAKMTSCPDPVKPAVS